MDYPKAHRADHFDHYHSIEVHDPYRWLEDVDSLKTGQWIDEQNRLSESYFQNLGRSKLISAHLERINRFHRFVYPVVRGPRLFYYRKEPGQEHFILYTRSLGKTDERPLIDPETLGKAEEGIALTRVRPSPDGKLVAYATVSAGSDWQIWRVRDVALGSDIEDELNWIKFSLVSWTNDNQGFFYAGYAEPTANKLKDKVLGQKLFYHRLGTKQSEDLIVYDNPDEPEWMYLARVTDDGRYLIVIVYRKEDDKNLIYAKDLKTQGSSLMPLISYWVGNFVFVGSEGATLWFRTDDSGPRGRVVEVNLDQGEVVAPKEVIAEREESLLRVSVLNNSFVITYIHNAHTLVKIFDRQGVYQRDVTLPGIGSAIGFDGSISDKTTYYSFDSYRNPPTVYRYDLMTDHSLVFFQPDLRFEPKRFETKQIFYESKDGSKIPMFITLPKNIVLDGKLPTLVYGYGGFSHSLTPTFNTLATAWLEMGGIYAVCNIRGGGEFGEDWHRAGSLLNKHKCFEDFICGAEYLIAQGYTNSKKLAGMGRSNGGLLVAACMLKRPDLFHAVLPIVGVLDMLRFKEFTIGWNWESEYGHVDEKNEFTNLYAYSPYHNVKRGAYPATLVLTGDHDDRVFPAHSYKFAAALQHAQTSDAPIFCKVTRKSGHGHGRSTTQVMEEINDCLSFLSDVLKMDLNHLLEQR